MTVTARYLAWLHSIKPTSRQHLGLALMETALLLAWALMLDSVIRFATSAYLHILPLTFILAANILAWLEDPGVSRMADPMTAKGLAEVDSNGRKPPRWRTLLRLLVTPPALLLLMAGFLPVLSGRRSLPEVCAGVRLVALDPSLDPRRIDRIMSIRSRNRRTVLVYTFLSLAIAALIILIPLDGRSGGGRAAGGPVQAMDEHDRDLMATYLEQSALYPDSIEFHVRLASLYYRNEMKGDLEAELDYIERLDPGNPMLLLRQDLEGPEVPGTEGMPELSELGFGPPEDVQEADSLSSDSLATQGAAADSSQPGPVPAGAAPEAGATPSEAAPEEAPASLPVPEPAPE